MKRILQMLPNDIMVRVTIYLDQSTMNLDGDNEIIFVRLCRARTDRDRYIFPAVLVRTNFLVVITRITIIKLYKRNIAIFYVNMKSVKVEFLETFKGCKIPCGLKHSFAIRRMLMLEGDYFGIR